VLFLNWNEVRATFPNNWVLFEVVEAYSKAGKRHIEDLAVVDSFAEWLEAVKKYKEARSINPYGEFYFFHTDREELEILESDYLSLRGVY